MSLRNRDGRVVTVSEDRFLLEELEDAGIRLPYGCRFGACLTCAALLVEGQVDHTKGRAFALRPRHVEEGYVLLCVARPLTDCVIDVGTQPGLYVNPFRYPTTPRREPH